MFLTAIAAWEPPLVVHPMQRDPLVLPVWLGDQVGVPVAVLQQLQDRVARTLNRVGVQVAWSRNPAEVPTPLIVLVTPDNRAAGLKVRDPQALAVTLRSPHAMGTVYIFFGRVDRAARAHRAETATVLACAVVHEIGHALLPKGSHASTGIMRGAWDDQQFRMIATGDLGFSTEEASAIRTALERRLELEPRSASRPD
jgi:hypothetical protein